MENGLVVVLVVESLKREKKPKNMDF